MLGKPKHLGIQNGRMGLAVSDGELNSSGGRGSNNSVNSLPISPNATQSVGQTVARWAESFETLLQDRLGVAYFTEFLKKEFSAENVYFWQACERFQKIPASSTQQIFNLMKFDSYARFVKSPLYQACARAESQGQPLPELRPHSRSGSPPSDHDKRTKLKAGKSLPLGVEAAGNLAGRSPRRSFRKGDRRERPWGEERNGSEGPSMWRESQGSLNSSASLDLGFLSSCATSSSQTESHRKSLTGSETENQNQPVKYCCVYLPDGTASLAPVRSGLSIQDMLAGICQRRGLHLPDVKIYLVGNEKKPLALNQDSLVLMDQEVKLETRVSFELEITPINKTVRILAKSTKHLQEALQPILEKYGLDVTRVLLRRPGEQHAVNLEEKVSTVATQKLVLESDEEVKPVDVGHVVAGPSCEQSEDDSSVGTESEAESLPEMSTKPSKSNHNRRTYDLEGLVELLNRAQNCRVDDQRGLLSKEDLVLPEFLQLREQVAVSCKVPSSSSPPQKKGLSETLHCEAVSVSPCQSQVQSEPQMAASVLQTGCSSSTDVAGKTSAM
ncbi:regulator of G-protein signaling 14 isoform X2 [Tiliqua scincoides]|uniref:regulator of G-protein signaling 14 isoform X2 n=1 Tax=Tiliqua scincoides TaxID=71010 RepID=UPI0034625D25